MLKNKLLIIGLLVTSVVCAQQNIRVHVVRGEEITPYVKDITDLCLTIYKEYPYLYEGTEAEYMPYIQDYTKSADGIACLLFDGDNVVGVATGLPMVEMRSHYQQAFVKNKYQDLAKLFYVGELILLKQYRGKGYGKRLYQEIESFVKKTDRFTTISFCQILEPVNHPMKDAYLPHDGFWSNLGFQEQQELNITVNWLNVHESTETPHTLIYWIKPLN